MPRSFCPLRLCRLKPSSWLAASRKRPVGPNVGFRKIFGRKATLDAGLLVRLDAVKPLLLDGVSFDQLPQRLKPIRLKHSILPPDED